MQAIRGIFVFLLNILVLALMVWGFWKLFTTFSFGEIVKYAALFGLVAFVIWLYVVRFLDARLERAKAEYRQLQAQYGSSAPSHCPHKYVSLSQTGVPGVISMTHKWCRICSSNLGTAKLKSSIFGDRWV